MKALDKDQVDSKMMKNEKIFKPTKRSKKFWSPVGLLAGICILTGKKSSQKMKNLTYDLVSVFIIWFAIRSVKKQSNDQKIKTGQLEM